jgi:hypothetical protein
MNESVTHEEDIIYFYVTSQDDKVEERYSDDINAYVILSPDEVNDYFNNPDVSFIQCGIAHLFSITYRDFRSFFMSGDFEKTREIDSVIIEKIITAIKSSITYTDRERRDIFNI